MKAIGFFNLLFCFPNPPCQKMLHSGKLTLAMGNPRFEDAFLKKVVFQPAAC